MSQRVQFGSTLDSYGSIQSKIAKMALQAYVTEVPLSLSCVLVYFMGILHVVDSIHDKCEYGQRGGGISA